MKHVDLGSTQPLPLILTLAQGQPAAARRWARSAARTLAHCLGVALVIVVFFALAAGPALMLGK